MTTATKTASYVSGWNVVVDALERNEDISVFGAKIKKIQAQCSPSNGLFHYAEGAKDAIAYYVLHGKIPERK